MAKPDTLKFGKFFVGLSDGASPPTFVAPCGFTSKSFVRNKTLGEVNVPDCDDPDAPSWMERDVQSMSGTITGQGVMAKSAVPIWEEAYDSTESIECEIEFLWDDGDTDTYTGFFHIESFEVTGNIGERANISVTMQSDGIITYARTS